MKLALMMSLLGGLIAAAAPVPVTLCNVLNQVRTDHAQHVKFASSFYAAEYPQLAVTHKYIGAWEAGGLSTQRGVARAFALNSSDCTLVIGPGASALATALNPLINTPWIEFGSTATEFSSRSSYPYFTRVISNTGITTRSVASVLQLLGWTTINMLYSTSSHGQSAASAMSSSLAAHGQILRSDSVPNEISLNDMTALLSIYLQSPTKLLFVATATTDAAQATFVTAAMAMNLTDHLVVFFSEGMCSSGNQWLKLRGSFCIGTRLVAENAAPFVRAYLTTRNVQAEIAEFTSLGFPPTRVDTTTTGSYQSLAADAARFGLRALGQYVDQRGSLSGGTTALVGAISNHVMSNGLTGSVSIVNTTGDRVGASFIIMNALPGLTAVPAFNITAQGNISLTSAVFLLGNDYALDSVPPLFDTLPSAQDVTNLVVGVTATCVVMVALTMALLVALGPRWKVWKRLQTAPRDDATPFTIVFTDIERSTALWAVLPEHMGTVLDTQNAIIRAALEAHGGYEVKTIGDSFMCAFTSAKAALSFAVAVQEGLHRAEFIPAVDDFYRQMMHEMGVPIPADYDALWHGVRVRIGMHTGTGSIVLDTVHNIYDYYGPVVNTAARIENMGHGGQILASDATMQAAGFRSAAVADRLALNLTGSGALVTSLGVVALRGVPEPVPLFDVRPTQLVQRTFPSRLRFVADEYNNDSDEEASHPSSDVDGPTLIRDVLKILDGPRTETVSELQRKRSSSDMTKGLGALAETAAGDARARVRRLFVQKFKRCATGSTEAKQRSAFALDLYLALNAMLKVFPAQRRTRVLSDASAAWRISNPQASPSESDHEQELLLLLALKLVNVLGAARVLSSDAASNDKLLDSTEGTSDGDEAVVLHKGASATAMKQLPLP